MQNETIEQLQFFKFFNFMVKYIWGIVIEILCLFIVSFCKKHLWTLEQKWLISMTCDVYTFINWFSKTNVS
jgi:hypothetical protein